MRNAQSSILCFILLLALVALRVNGQGLKSKGFLIYGTIKGIDSGTIKIVSREGKSSFDSSQIEKGRFIIKGHIDSSKRLVFSITPGNWNFKAFVEDTILTVSVDTAGAQYYENEHEKWALIWNVEQTGSELSNTSTRYNRETNFLNYTNLILSLRKELGSVKQNKDAESKVNKEIDSLSALVYASQKSWIEDYISQHPSSIAGVYLLLDYYHLSNNLSVLYLDSILNKFSGNAISSIYFKEMVDIVTKLKNRQTDRILPDFTLLKRDKSSFALSSLRGQYVLLDFWASWCLPCRKAIPLWKSMYAKYKKRGLMIVSVSNDRKSQDWIKALNKEQMPWIQLIDKFPDPTHPALVSELFGIKAIPFYVLLDKGGKVLLSSMDDKLIRDKIQEVVH